MRPRLPKESVYHHPVPLRPDQELELAKALSIRKGVVRLDIDRTATGASRISIVHTDEDADINQVVKALLKQFKTARHRTGACNDEAS
jgi:hypothetical protein